MRIEVDRPLLFLRSALAEIAHVVPVSPLEASPSSSDFRVLPRETWSKTMPPIPSGGWGQLPKLDIEGTQTRLLIYGDDREFDIRAAFPSVEGVAHTLLMVDASSRLVVCVETEISENDGVTQIRNDPPGLVLMLHSEMQAQKGHRLLRGTTFRSLRAERRAGSGWESLPITFDGDEVGLRALPFKGEGGLPN